MKNLIIVIVNQEYQGANHKNFWESLANELTSVLILDIPSDLFVTILKGKYYRLKESMLKISKVNNFLQLIRPFYVVRPELLPNFLEPIIKKRFWNILKKYIDIDNYQISILAYDPKWIRILNNNNTVSREKYNLFYYIIDELRLNASDGKFKRKTTEIDKLACRFSTHIFATTNMLLKNRTEFLDKITVIGNGAEYNNSIGDYDKIYKIPNSIGYIGNFRNWIDFELLTSLINYRPELKFFIIGPVERNVRTTLRQIIKKNPNTVYINAVHKNAINRYYKMLEVIIVPYKQNDFISACRPIKIIESIFAGTPVVSVPVSGFEETNFVRFGKNYLEFSKNIDFFLNGEINKTDVNYQTFIEFNKSSSLVKRFIDEVDKYLIN